MLGAGRLGVGDGAPCARTLRMSAIQESVVLVLDKSAARRAVAERAVARLGLLLDEFAA